MAIPAGRLVGFTQLLSPPRWVAAWTQLVQEERQTVGTRPPFFWATRQLSTPSARNPPPGDLRGGTNYVPRSGRGWTRLAGHEQGVTPLWPVLWWPLILGCLGSVCVRVR